MKESQGNEQHRLNQAGFWLVLIAMPAGAVLLRLPVVLAILGAALLATALAYAVANRPHGALNTVAFIVGAEVSFRIAGAPLPYEFGKYAVVAVLLACFVLRPAVTTRTWWPMTYLIPLLPSVILTLAAVDYTLRQAVQSLSFTLSGPLCLGVSWLVADLLALRSDDWRRLQWAVLGGTCFTCGMVMYSVWTADNLTFNTESNIAASGGFGPNQVSVALGLGMLVGLMRTIDPQETPIGRVVAAGATLALTLQGLLTFSRGGIYTAAIAAAVLIGFSGKLSRRRIVVGGGAILILIGLVIFPYVNRFTGGKLEERYRSTDTTNRSELILDDLRIFFENPLLGVGPGRITRYRPIELSGTSHTELSRIPAEHGFGGLVSLLVLVAASARLGLSPSRSGASGVQRAFLVWSVVSMTHAGMRIAAIGFVFALSQAHMISRSSRGGSDD